MLLARCSQKKFITNHTLVLENLLINLEGAISFGRSKISYSSLSPEVQIHPAELPRKLQRMERKPWVVDVNVLKRRARLDKQMRFEVRENILKPPENGLLVKELVPVAHKVFVAREELFGCVSRVMDSIPVHKCLSCGEVHVGNVPNEIKTCNAASSPFTVEHNWERGRLEDVLPVVETFHLYDRVGRAVSHEERLLVDRIPAILELCVQAGVDLREYPTRRRAFPVYNVSGRIIDYEKRFPKDEFSGKDIDEFGFWEKRERRNRNTQSSNLLSNDLQECATRGMSAWEEMRSGAMKLMQKYAVQTCGYCPEVQVGPKGHRLRQCQSYKHQMRDGQHAWQEATVDDMMPPVYVWHVPKSYENTPLSDKFKRYYGKLPAAVELFAQAGAKVSEQYSSLMREDVAVPTMDEEKLVV
ncbi:hypothetical protein Sjap_020877 [Stephania japonica]|uniref:APO domain-containing protein n=1 Tax=Stephania japonica TaxID=461633 RepID=A0AAP0F6T6_9MAGN